MKERASELIMLSYNTQRHLILICIESMRLICLIKTQTPVETLQLTAARQMLCSGCYQRERFSHLSNVSLSALKKNNIISFFPNCFFFHLIVNKYEPGETFVCIQFLRCACLCSSESRFMFLTCWLQTWKLLPDWVKHLQIMCFCFVLSVWVKCCILKLIEIICEGQNHRKIQECLHSCPKIPSLKLYSCT